MAELRIGTSAFTAEGWEGTFYPKGIAAREQLTYYATQFDTVELDNTFYRTPASSTVKGWYAKTPPGFVFAAKVPQVITHEKMLVDCEADFKHFLGTMDELREKLRPFLEKLPSGYKFAVEIRNKYWLDAKFVETLREHGVALALIDQSWMPRPWEIKGNLDLITADFTYVRWLGDRKAIEEQTTSWDKTIVDRSGELKEWVDVFMKFFFRNIKIFAFANNHYAGHGPATVRQFQRLLAERAGK